MGLFYASGGPPGALAVWQGFRDGRSLRSRQYLKPCHTVCCLGVP